MFLFFLFLSLLNTSAAGCVRQYNLFVRVQFVYRPVLLIAYWFVYSCVWFSYWLFLCFWCRWCDSGEQHRYETQHTTEANSPHVTLSTLSAFCCFSLVLDFLPISSRLVEHCWFISCLCTNTSVSRITTSHTFKVLYMTLNVKMLH